MPEFELPFRMAASSETHEDLEQCAMFRMLPPAMQQVCRTQSHVLEYLHRLPLEEIGIPQYYEELSRKLGDLKQRNLMYPVSDNVLVHVWSGTSGERDIYIPVEPIFSMDLDQKLAQIENHLLHMADRFGEMDVREEREAALREVMSIICEVSESGTSSARHWWKFGRNANNKVAVTPKEYNALSYMVLRDKVGMGVMEPLMLDVNIEDISCSGVGPVFIEHKVFKGMTSAINFVTHDELDQYVIRLSEQIKRPVTMRNPIVDAMLPDGSRINIVYGREVSQRGSNFTIRKFSDTPFSILELIEFGSMDYRMAAYLSLVLEEGMNTFVAGETASGKTTLLNAITTFVPPSAKVVSIEDTPEIQVPHPNWIREVAKQPKKDDVGAVVTMMDLLKAALRQRPNLIIIGEIRGEEGAVAFQAMQTGHAVMATFHASSVEKLIQRLTGEPINIPKNYIDNLNVVVIQSAIKLKNGKMARRAMSISEIVGYDPPTESFSFVEVFRWDPVTDTFEFVGDKSSYLLEEKIAPKRGLPPNKKWEIYNVLEKRARVLERLHHDKGVTDYYELLKIIARAQEEGIF